MPGARLYRAPPARGLRELGAVRRRQRHPGQRGRLPIVDPAGKGPEVFFQPVPEPKTAKNRLHIDLRVSVGASGSERERQARIDAAVAPLLAAGATLQRRSDDPEDLFIVMQDPEGNEFCLV